MDTGINNTGVNLMIRQNDKPSIAGKDMPRGGAAKGQGAGLKGYQAGIVNKAMSSVKGSGGAPTYFCGDKKMK